MEKEYDDKMAELKKTHNEEKAKKAKLDEELKKVRDELETIE
jgi:hypothetical protein